MMERSALRSDADGQRFDVFLSYSRRDAEAVEQVARRLKRAGLEPWLDTWSLTPGGEWQRELEVGLHASAACAVFVGAGDLGAWEMQEVAMAIYQAVTQPDFRVIPVLLPGVEEPFDPNRLPHLLRMRTWVDLRAGIDDERVMGQLIAAVDGPASEPQGSGRGEDDVAPYVGLRVFEEHDAPWFFGRDREIQRLLEKLKASRFVAVVGPSGSGKSSLVRAGLVPELRAPTADDGGASRVVVLRPGPSPLTALAAQLADLCPGASMQATLDEVAADERTLHLCVELALAPRSREERVVVVVDQLEEVFTLCRDEVERRQLFALLLHAASAVGGRTVVIVTMRDDFYGRCAAYPEFAQLIAAHQLLVGPMTTDDLRQVIEQPARRVGLGLEDGLVDAILGDAGSEPGSLPLLEHALLELWQLRRGGMLTLGAYGETGGVRGALAQRAEHTYAAFSAAEQQIARRVLLRLTQPGEGTEDTRRRATRDELSPFDGDASVGVVIAGLVDARLLTTGRDESAREVVDVAHEALIRDWPRLRAWIDADRAGLLTHRRLSDAAREWGMLDREPGALYRGARLGTAREWATGRMADLSALEREFLTVSERAEHTEREAVQRRQRRRLLMLRSTVGVSLLVAALAAWALAQRGDALTQRGVARDQAANATSLALASLAPRVLEQRPDVSLLLGLAAYQAAPRPEASDSVIRTLTAIGRSGPVVGILRGHTDTVFGVAFSADGRTLASAGFDGTVRLWDTRTHNALGAPLRGHTGSVFAVAFSADGRTLASAGFDGTVRLWDTRTRKARGAPLHGHGGSEFAVAFSADGRTLASAGIDGTVSLWDALTHKALGAALRGARPVLSVAFSTDGRTLASGSDDGTLRLWGARTHKALGVPLRGHAGAVNSVAFSADGRTLASGSDDNTVRLWDTRTHKTLGAPLRGHTGPVKGVAFSADGRTLASASEDGTVRLWDSRTRKTVGAPLRGQAGPVKGVAFSADGRTLASGNDDGTLRLWDSGKNTTLGAPLRGHTDAVYEVAFSPDGRTLASAGDDGTVRLWDTRTHTTAGAPLRGHTGPVTGLAFSADGRTLASASDDGTVRVWDIRTHRTRGVPLRGVPIRGRSVALSADGRTLATSDDRTVRLWDTRTHKALGAPLRGHAGVVYSVAFSADGRTLASGGDDNDNTVRLWDIRTHETLGAPLRAHTTIVNSNFVDGSTVYTSVAFSADGRTLASGSDDGTVRLWDTRTHKTLGAALGGHTGRVTGVAFSTDGRTLASGSDDGTLRLWDIRTHKALGAPLRGHTGSGVLGVAFSADGRTLATAGDDGTVRLWEHILWHDRADLQATVCRFVGRGLSKAEWMRYVTAIPYRATCG